MNKRKINSSPIFGEMIDKQTQWYVDNSDDPNIPDRFLEAVEKAIEDITHFPAMGSKFLTDRPEFSHLDNLNLRDKNIGDKFPYNIYYDFDDDVVNFRFGFKNERELERHISEKVEEEKLDEYGDIDLDKLGKTPDKPLPSKELNDDENER